MKKSIFVVTVVALALAVPLALNAASDPARNSSEQGRYADLPPEKAQLFDKMLDEHADLARPLHRELKQKFMELEYVSRLQQAEVKDITKLLDEINKIQNKVQDLELATEDKIQKQLGIAYRPGVHFPGEYHGRWGNERNRNDHRGSGWGGGCRNNYDRPYGWGHGSRHDGKWKHYRGL
ncbi:MAG: periplasmic heavy metal sensor [Deltaproteobacteria bacterium]|nr:periplasmic heavy metal sensor [Deltaproteobacteria bacterium]